MKAEQPIKAFNIFSLGFVLIGGGSASKRERLATLRINLEAKKLLPELLRQLNLQVKYRKWYF